jgi:hypothetical protein
MDYSSARCFANVHLPTMIARPHLSEQRCYFRYYLSLLLFGCTRYSLMRIPLRRWGFAFSFLLLLLLVPVCHVIRLLEIV